MKKTLVLLLAVSCLASVVALSGSGALAPKAGPDLIIEREDRNPFTHLRMGADVDFQFAIVSDRTGGHRAKIFDQAINKINLLQPEFVVSVGDLIEGSKKKEILQKEWTEFDGYVNKLTMPFFYVAGNHDAGNVDSAKFWQEKLGRRHYHFVYRNVLFLVLNSNDPPGSARVSKEQVAWTQKVVADNAFVQHTLVFVHHPLWTADPKKSNWPGIEEALGARPYTVFCGHLHRFQKYVRNGRNYYQLATTGGGSRLRGVERGEMDHITWVTMKKDGPVLAHILLDSVVPEDLKIVDSEERGVPSKREPTHPTRGKVYFEGTPIPGAVVVLEPVDVKSKAKRADGAIEADGSFSLTTYRDQDGAVAGEYNVSVTWKTSPAGKTAKLLPARYAAAAKSGLRATIRPGENLLVFELRK